jgi:hypothetical protein
MIASANHGALRFRAAPILDTIVSLLKLDAVFFEFALNRSRDPVRTGTAQLWTHCSSARTTLSRLRISIGFGL